MPFLYHAVKHRAPQFSQSCLILSAKPASLTCSGRWISSSHGARELSRAEAERLDHEDPLKQYRDEFLFPSKNDLRCKTLPDQYDFQAPSTEPCIYLCGHSLGLQPRRTINRVQEHLVGWATKGAFGHFFEHDGARVPPFAHVDDLVAPKMTKLVGALESETAVMETLTANLHFLMASFYWPTKTRNKIILEGRAFPSDHYAIESQIKFHGHDPQEAMVLLEPTSPVLTLTTSEILTSIDRHAESAALLLLPGVQYYTGQLFDIQTITQHAQSKGLVVGWDMAHAVGNVPLQLHDWNIDFAVWCTYKYLNSGPGNIGALFVHERHGQVDRQAIAAGRQGYMPRLAGWWGGEKSTRFEMANDAFVPIPGAKGWQVGNSSGLAAAALFASLEIFNEVSIGELRAKSIRLTSFLESLLQQQPHYGTADCAFRIITPTDPAQRGAQLSIQLQPNFLTTVERGLSDAGVVIDERRPDVIRVAPMPLYNSFQDVWDFVQIFRDVCREAIKARDAGAAVAHTPSEGLTVGP